MLRKICSAALVLSFSAVISAQAGPSQATPPKPTTAAEAPGHDTSYIDEKGTAHVTRVVPVPEDLSPEAKKSLSGADPDQGPPQSLEERRKGTDAYTARAREEWETICL